MHELYFTYSNIKQRNHLSIIVYNIQSILVLMQISILPLKVYAFSEQGAQTTTRKNGTGIPSFQITSVSFPRGLHTELLQGWWLRWFSLTDYSSQEYYPDILKVPPKIPEP